MEMAESSGKDRAWLLLKVAPTTEKGIVDQVRDMEFIEEASVVYGKYDIIAKAAIPNIADFDNAVVKKIRAMPGVESTLTLVSTKV